MKKRRLAQILLLALAIAFICHGIGRGEAFTVFIKGSNICLECIGLG
ncbi:MAG: hypothetical protein FWF04_04685 [Clostridiales bacterium]|nr:hypothetical protein [Clostridiales bacterium]